MAGLKKTFTSLVHSKTYTALTSKQLGYSLLELKYKPAFKHFKLKIKFFLIFHLKIFFQSV